MLLGDTLYEPGGQLSHVYFPTTSIVSLLYIMESGVSAEIAGVGNEGVLGISLFMGGDTTPSSAVVQTAGHGYRLPAALLKEEFNRGGPVQRLLLRYTQALVTQMFQTGACNRHHSIEQQLCRWLLLTLDRMPSQRAHHHAGTGREHARRAPRRRDRGRRKFAACRNHQLPARSHICAQTRRTRSRLLRMLRRRQERNWPPAGGCTRAAGQNCGNALTVARPLARPPPALRGV